MTLRSAHRVPISAATACKPGLVAIGQREVAAARGEFQRQRPADAAGGSRHRRGGSLDRSHVGSMRVKNCAGTLVPSFIAGFSQSFRPRY